MNTTLTAVSHRKVQWRLPEPPKRRLRDEFADWMRTRIKSPLDSETL